MLSKMAADVDWFCRELAKLGMEVTEDIARYILSMKAVELDEYMQEVVDASDPKVRVFLQELHVRCSQDSHSKNTIKIYKKDLTEANNKNSKKKKNPEIGSGKAISGGSHKPVSNGGFHEMSLTLAAGQSNASPSKNNLDATITGEIGVGAKRKTKFVPLFSQEGQAKSVIHLPGLLSPITGSPRLSGGPISDFRGRHVCECQAAKHKLINNCISCGRIVCDQEGAGPCVFCGTLVYTPEDQAMIEGGTKRGEKLRQHLLKAGSNSARSSEQSSLSAVSVSLNKSKQGAEHALQHRDKLLEFDRTSARRTQVIDDECDYYSTDSNQWLSNEDREKLRRREEELRNARHGSRRDRKITFDFAGRRVIDAEDDSAQNMYSRDDEVLQEVHGMKPSVEKYTNAILNPDIQLQSLKFVDSVPWGPARSDKENESGANFNPSQSNSHRLQDKELQEIVDDGMCLSMHQPWASLLVVGIKMHEGRTWYTTHRGRLWIASTAKTPTPDEIRELERVHTHLLDDPNLSFPKNYPTGCLLGCVNVDDCLSQEQYREQFPNGESASPFVFICSNPQQLIVKFPIKGKHKIYKLDQHIHQAAKKGIR